MENYHKPIKAKTSGTGGKRRKAKDKQLAHWGSPFTATKVSAKGREVRKVVKIRGKGRKVKLKEAAFVNMLTKEGKMAKVKITNVLETPANRHFARGNLLVKGAVVQTEGHGKAVVTNRVGQDGVVNGRQI